MTLRRGRLAVVVVAAGSLAAVAVALSATPSTAASISRHQVVASCTPARPSGTQPTLAAVRIRGDAGEAAYVSSRAWALCAADLRWSYRTAVQSTSKLVGAVRVAATSAGPNGAWSLVHHAPGVRTVVVSTPTGSATVTALRDGFDLVYVPGAWSTQRPGRAFNSALRIASVTGFDRGGLALGTTTIVVCNGVALISGNACG